MDAVRTENLTKLYGKHRGIDGLNLSVREGAWYGFIGPNGAGKSTTIRTLLGLIYPTSGRASVFGLDIVKDHMAIMERVGYLPSEAFFYPSMTVGETLSFSLSLHRIKDKSYQERLCSRLELDMERRIGELSYGNRKKVGIVAAMQHHPSLLIMDEPTGGLDPLMQQEFFSLLEEENREGTTIFFSSHILSEIERHSSEAAFIKDGRIILSGDVSVLSRTSTRRVSFRGKADLSSLSGIKEERREGDRASFLYSGSASELLSVLAKGNIMDFTVTEPDLEEIFLHYYKEEE